ncbi:MAG: trehalose-phosphatase [Candidatus Omnitrophica bacterium]|nr:trehalose-phosphatase [Candidatus Omnitrophota bacterium]
MKNLLDFLDDILQSWANKKILLFLDYDGTLAPIASVPSQAVCPKENRELIERLSQIAHYQVVIIGGRPLEDLKQMVSVKNVFYIGNHGWEIESSPLHMESLISVQAFSVMRRIKHDLTEQLSSIPGVLLEDKGVTLSVHYRMVSQDKEFQVRRIFEHICMPYRRQNMIKVYRGKKVLELRPWVQWDKGKAALWLLRKQEVLWGKGNVLPFYIGDDTTDEDAFEALRNKGVTVFVGDPKLSRAQYCLPGPQDVTELLKHMIYGAYEKLAVK